MLGVGRASIYWYERTGRLTATRIGEYVYYAETEILRFKSEVWDVTPRQPKRKKRRKGTSEPIAREIRMGGAASHVMKCLREGKDLAQTVIETRQHPDFVRRMWAEMQTGFQAAEREKRLRAEERLVARLSQERVQRAKLEHRERMQEIRLKKSAAPVAPRSF